jgi:transposase
MGRRDPVSGRCSGAPWCSSYAVVDRFAAESSAPVILSLSTATRIFVALEPVDMRQSFNGLHALVQRVLKQDQLSGQGATNGSFQNGVSRPRRRDDGLKTESHPVVGIRS